MIKILLPTDFSENAYNAICYALQLFQNKVCTFYLLHTYTPAIYRADYILDSPGQIGLGDVYQVSSATKLEKLQQKLIEEFNNPKHTFITHTAFNTLVDEISETVENEHIDLILMGTQGVTNAAEVLLGTNAVHVMSKATCPVITVPPNFTYEVPKEILFPTDYEIVYQKKQFGIFEELAKEHISRIHILHVSNEDELSEEQKQNKSSLGKIFKSVAHLFHDMPHQEIVSAINNFQLKNKVNLLAMVKNKHTLLERLFIKPVIKKIGFHPTIPFMVIPHPQKN